MKVFPSRKKTSLPCRLVNEGDCSVKCGGDWLTVIIFAHKIPQPEGNARKELEFKYPPPMTLDDPTLAP